MNISPKEFFNNADYMVLVFIAGYVINGVIHLVEVIVRRIRRKK